MSKLNLDLEGRDGNAFMLLGFFRAEAKKAGWKSEEINKVLQDAQSGDYNHLLQVLLAQ